MPSLINELIDQEVKGVLDSSNSVILVDPAGLKAAESLALRRKLHDVGASMQQTKRRLIARNLPEEVREHLNGGSLAMVVGEDIAAAAKILNELVKEEKVALRAGFVEGQAVDAKGAAKIAELPTKHEAHAMLARALRAPAVKLTKLVRLPYVRLARALNKHKENNEESS